VSDAVAAGVVPAGPTKVARRRRLEEAARGYAAASKAPNILCVTALAEAGRHRPFHTGGRLSRKARGPS
jgi:hypothetical protein